MKVCKTCGCEVDIINIAMCVKCGDTLCEACALANKFKCKECNGEKPKFELDFIRRSHIDTYKACPYAFYLEVIKGMEVPMNIYAHVGIELHELYDKHQKGEIDKQEVSSGTTETILSCRGKWDDELVNKLDIKAQKATEHYLSICDDLPGKLVITEETLFINIKEGLPKVRITMDMIREDEEGNLHILDWKTGKVMTGQNLATNLQVPLYIKAVQDNYGKPVKSFTLIYLSEGKERKYVHVGEDRYECTVKKRVYKISIGDTIKEIQSLFGKIIGGLFNIPDRPNYFHCKQCHFGDNGTCARSDKQRWVNANQNNNIESGWGM
ncbi:RecB family exonuclease [Romboutsia sp.]|uniref:RecB family exonuclease n=1 Tax=Romboutsia sp. TaxID=1965302 RepID=UPI002BC1F307|nr:PD-(D/E)XK nuclease family protein [Romboutsia sp.]HSQ90173.1 PD-(D/E)XK nuclease family protein [Romboutsia sp.]